MESSEISKKGKFAVIIPVYNHENTVVAIINETLKFNMSVIVVDDGSTDSTHANMMTLKGIHLLRHEENRGKGAAILTGFAEAFKVADWAITIDADGQHNPADILQLIRAVPKDKRPVVVGTRRGMTGKNVPWTSRFGRKFSNFWVLLSGGPRMLDSQCGFRIYPLPETMNLNVVARRYQFEVEVLVKAKWNGIPVIETPISVNYAAGGRRISHFRPFVDFIRNTNTFARLITRRIFSSVFR